jgi:hypothetical protein
MARNVVVAGGGFAGLYAVRLEGVEVSVRTTTARDGGAPQDRSPSLGS